MLNKRSRSQMVLTRLSGHPMLSLASLARSMDIREATLKAYAYGRHPFPSDLMVALYQAVAEVDVNLADWAFEELGGHRLIGKGTHPLPAGLDRDTPAVDLMQAAAALGTAQGRVADANGVVDAYGAPSVISDARRAIREMQQAVAKAELAISRGAQRVLGLREVQP